MKPEKARAKNETNETRKRPKNAVTRARSKKWPDVFIDELNKRGVVKDAAKAAGVSRATAYRMKYDSTEFSTQWDDALENAADVMEAEAFRRAVKGTRKPIYQQGELVGFIQEYSDALLTLLLKANRPSKFNPPQESKIKLSGMTDDEIARTVKPILERLGIWIEPPIGEGLDSQADSGNKPA